MTDISVVIVSYESRDLLAQCLAALAADGQRRATVETIVVDQASQDGTAEWLASEHPEVQLVALAEKPGRDRRGRVEQQREPPAGPEVEGSAHAGPRAGIAASRCEAAAVQLQRATVERGATVDRPELRPAGSVPSGSSAFNWSPVSRLHTAMSAA